MQIISYSTKLIFQNDEEKQLLLETLKAEQACFNFCSQEHFGSKKNSIVELHAKCYRKLRDLYPEIPAQIVIKSEQSCLSVYRSIKSNKHKITKSCVKKRLSLQLDKRLYSYKNETFRITTIKGRICCKFFHYKKLDELLSTYQFGDPLLYVKNDIVYIRFSFKIPSTVVKCNQALGVDLGIRRYAATSEGKLFKDSEFNAKKRRLRYLKRCLQSKKTKSSKKHMKKLYGIETNRNKELCRQLSKQIVESTNCNTIVIEDLSQIKQKIKSKNKYRNLNKLSQIPFYMLRQCLTTKAHLSGKQVITVNPSFTSQIDHQTGRKSGIRKGCRFYARAKRGVYDADVNAAINIAKRSKLPVSYSNVLDGQAVVNQPIVCKSKSHKDLVLQTT